MRQRWIAFWSSRFGGWRSHPSPLVRALRPYWPFLDKYILPPFRLWLRLDLKLLSWYILFLLYFNIFTTETTLGFTIYIFALIVGIFPGSHDSITIFELCCLLYASFALGSTLFLYLAFKSSTFTAWCFKSLGEERVRRLAERFILSQSTARVAGIGLVVATAGGFLVEEGSRFFGNQAARDHAAQQTADIERRFSADLARAEAERNLLMEKGAPYTEIGEDFYKSVSAAEDRRERERREVNQVFRERLNAPGVVRHAVTAIQTVLTRESETRAAGTIAQAQDEAAKADAEARGRIKESIAGATGRSVEGISRVIGSYFGRSRD